MPFAKWLPQHWKDSLEALQLPDEGYGYDSFGINAQWIRNTLMGVSWLYDSYFRVSSYHSERIPLQQSCILASNHSGVLPFDGVMIYLDVLKQKNRIIRPIADYFVSDVPFLNTFFSRVGVIGGSRGNFQRILEQGEWLLVFPEGVPGISKPPEKKYQLQDWRVGHVELAIRHRSPVVPVAVVGAEEQMQQFAQIPLRWMGAPFLPLYFPLLPLPVHYHILYGEPLFFHHDYTPEQSNDPLVLKRCSEQVKTAVDTLLQEGLALRKGVFV